MTWHLEPTDTAKGRFPCRRTRRRFLDWPAVCDCHGGPETEISISEAGYRTAVGSSSRVAGPVSNRQLETRMRPSREAKF